MKVLVVGATGFVGSAVARALLEAGHSVTGLRRPGSSLEGLRGLELPWFEGDVRDPHAVRVAIRGHDAVVHTTGALSIWPRAREHVFAVNVLGTRNVAAACLEAGVRLVACGSAAVYCGTSRLEPMDERGAPTSERFSLFPVTVMALAEAEVLRAHARGLDAVLLHPGLVVGPGDRGFHSSWLLLGRERARLELCPPGGVNLVPVADVARAHVLALARAARGSIYLLGGENLANQALLELVQAVLGKKAPLLSLPRGPFRALGKLAHAAGLLRGRDVLDRFELNDVLALAATLYWFVDSSRAERELGWKAGPVRPALEAQLEWLRREAPHRGRA